MSVFCSNDDDRRGKLCNRAYIVLSVSVEDNNNDHRRGDGYSSGLGGSDGNSNVKWCLSEIPARRHMT